jgi:hypothetical protein
MRSGKHGRPALPKVDIDDEMRRFCSLISAEVNKWQDTSSRKMFGMLSFYRELPGFPQPRIFACLPDKRALSSPRAISFKLVEPKLAHISRMKADSRVSATEAPKHLSKWFDFSINEPGDVDEALWWLEQAYRATREN